MNEIRKETKCECGFAGTDVTPAGRCGICARPVDLEVERAGWAAAYSLARQPQLTLVGGPFDGDTMEFRADQRAIVVPESIDGALHRYEVAADGRAHYAANLSEDRAERLARALYEHHVEEVSDGDTSDYNPWDLLDDDEKSYERRHALWLLERGFCDERA